MISELELEEFIGIFREVLVEEIRYNQAGYMSLFLDLPKKIISKTKFSTISKIANYIIKEINVSMETKELRKQLKKQMNIDFKHPNVFINYIGYFVRNEILYVFEEAFGIPLYDKIMSDAGYFPKKSLPEIALQIAKALSILHNEDIIHKNLSSYNVFIEISEEINVKISTNQSIPYKKVYFSKNRDKELNKNIKRYQSPETQSKNLFLPETDIYSFGIVVYELKRKKLYSKDEIVMSKLIKTKDKKIIYGSSSLFSLLDISNQCICLHPGARPRLTQLIERLEVKSSKFK